MDAEPAIWWTLPGPRGFVTRVIESLEDGRNCIVRVPSTISTDALRSALRKELAGRETLVWEHRIARELIERSHEPAHALAEIYGIARRSGTRVSPHDIALAPSFSSFALWLDGWNEVGLDHRRAWFEFLRQYAHAAKQRDVLQRSVICLAVSGAVALEPATGDEVLLADHCWWSAASRLDIAVLLDALGQTTPGDELLDAVLLRAAGFDPRLAAWLVSARCADRLSIERTLKEYAERFALVLTAEELELAQPAAAANASAERAVPPSLAAAWSRGLVNHLRKEGVHWHLAALAGAGRGEPLRREIWGAQASVLLPRIDQQRALICRYLDARYSNGWRSWHAENTAPADGEIVQIGQLKFLFDSDSRLRREPEELRRLVRWLHYARNELSHLRELSAQDLERGKTAVERTSAILGSPPGRRA